VVSLGSTLESVANNKVDAILATQLYDSLAPEERRKKIQDIVNEFMVQYKLEYDALKANLEAVKPPIPKEEIEFQLQDHESLSFEQFINAKIKEQKIEKRKDERRQRYIKMLVLTGDAEQDQKNRDLVGKFDPKYPEIKAKLIEERPELEKNTEELKKEIRKIIDTKFIEYCEQNGIQIDQELLNSGEVNVTDEGDDSSGEYVRLETK
jgi:hypothetical protein